MRKPIYTTLLFLVLFAPLQAFASTATDFYLELLRRGTTEVEAGRYETAITPLRLAAFGLIDSIDHYETAQAYLAVALDKLGQPEEARRSASRILSAESVERRFAALPLPAAIRTAFASVARKLLTSPEAAELTAPPVAGRSTAPATGTPPPSRSPVIPPAQNTTTTATRTPQQETKTVQFDPRPSSNGAATQNGSAPAPRKDPPKVTEQPKTTPAATQRPVPAQIQPQRVAAPKPATPPKPEPAKTVAPPPVTPPSSQAPRVDVPARLAAGERALGAANLPEARKIYRELLNVTTLDRPTLVRIGEGLYRARDFAPALTAFRRLGTLRTGEEAYRYYIAVALYETSEYAAAKRELAAALPFIELTPDVQRYRAKIEGARN